MLILHAQLLLGSKPGESGTPGEKKFVGALADHLDAVPGFDLVRSWES
jgi:hypothetical protein